MKLSTLFYRLPRLTVLATFVVVISGFFAILTLGRQEDPTLVERYGSIITTFPGADAERVEATVTEPLERRLSELPEIGDVVSSSRANVSQINIDLDESLTVAEVDNAWNLIRQQARLAQAELPDQAGEPLVRRFYVGASTMLIALTWEGQGDPPLAVLGRKARALEDSFRNLAATEETEIFGLPNEEVRVVMDIEALGSSGLTINQASALIAAADSKAPAGIIRGEKSNVGVEVQGEFDGLARIRDVPLLQRPDGSAVRVGDVATVEKGVEYPASHMALNSSKRTVIVAAYIQSGQRVDNWAETARALVDDFALTVDSNVAVDIIFDQSKYTTARLNGLARNLIFSAMIVFLVLFLVMGWRSAIVVGMALPLTIALVLFLFSIFDYPLHQMSVTGLVIALGLLIDNAIVVVDEFDQERARGLSVLDAMEHSLGKLFGPLFASTLTTALAFAPIAFMPGGAGEFIGMLGVSVIFSVCGSFLIAMTVIPAFAGWLDRPRYEDEQYRWWRDGLKFPILSEGYRWTVGTVLRFPILGLLIGFIPVILGFQLGTSLPPQFFPPTERDQFQVEITLPSQATLAEAERAALRATDIIQSYPEVEGVYFVLGEAGPRVYYNSFNNTQGVAGFASGFVQLKSAETSRIIVSDVQATLRDEFPNAQVLATPFEQGPPVDAPIAFYVRGENLVELDRIGAEMRGVLASTPGVTFTSALLERGSPVMKLDADEAAAALSGERLTGVSADLRNQLDGVVAGSVLEGIEEIPVRVIGSDERRGDLAQIRGAAIGTITGDGGTPLSALGNLTLEPETAVIVHRNGQRVNVIYGYIEPYALPAPILADFWERLDQSGFEMPKGYDVIIAGTAETSSEAVSGLLSLTIPLVLVMLGAVALVFNSFRFAILILASGVMSVGLAFGGVWMFNLPLGFNGIVGAVGLLGIAINGSIVVLSLLKADNAALADDVVRQRDIVVDATRHIVATTLTTMGGFVPIILTGDLFWMPLAAAIAGGVAGSGLLALYFVPSVFRIMTMKPIRRLWRSVAGRRAPTAAE